MGTSADDSSSNVSAPRKPQEAKKASLVKRKSMVSPPAAQGNSAAAANTLVPVAPTALVGGQSPNPATSGANDSLPLPVASPSSQYIVDKPPKTMKMTLGDHYYIPIGVTSLRVDFTWEYADTLMATSIPVDCGVTLMSNTAKRLGGVNSSQKTYKDRSIIHMGDESPPPQGHYGESIAVNLACATQDVSYAFCTISAGGGKASLSDLDKISIRVVDTGFFPGNPELFNFEFYPSRSKVISAVIFAFVKEKTLIRGATGPQSQTPTTLKDVPRELLVHLWAAKAIGFNLNQRITRQTAAEAEELAKKLTSGWLPVPKGIFQSGGDPSRIIGDRMMKKAQKSIAGATATTPAESELNASLKQGSLTAGSSEEDSFRARRDSVETVTPVDITQEEFEQLFLLSTLPRPNNQGRPRVVRRNRCLYSVGRPCAVPVERRRDSDSDEANGDDSDDEDLFRQVFADFNSRRVIRYSDHCYNIGTGKEALLQYYVHNREHLDSNIDLTSNPRAPLVVDRVFNDREPEDEANILGPPTLMLDDGPQGVLKKFSTAGFEDSPPLFRRATLSDGVEEYDFQVFNDTNAYPDPQSPKFGRLKPPPPVNILLLRHHQEEIRKEEYEKRLQREREEAQRAKLAAQQAAQQANEKKKNALGANHSQMSIGAISFKNFRGASAQTRIPTRHNSPGHNQRKVRSARPRRRPNPALFSGQLLQWIDMYMKLEERKKSPSQHHGSPQQHLSSSLTGTISPTNASKSSTGGAEMKALTKLFPQLQSDKGQDPVLGSEITDSQKLHSPTHFSDSKPTSAANSKRRTSNTVVIHEPSPPERNPSGSRSNSPSQAPDEQSPTAKPTSPL